jgi:uncharacterized lipoprotein YajG
MSLRMRLSLFFVIASTLFLAGISQSPRLASAQASSPATVSTMEISKVTMKGWFRLGVFRIPSGRIVAGS